MAHQQAMISSFGYDRKTVPACRVLVDCRDLPNPYQVPRLRMLTGLDEPVAAWVLQHPETESKIATAVARAEALAPLGPVKIAVGCAAGRHRAPAVAEAIGRELDDRGWQVKTVHTSRSMAAQGKARPRERRTTTQAGLGWRHQQQRERLMKLHIDGSDCWWCGEPMYRDAGMNPDGRVLEADHSQSRKHGGQVADRLLHSRCNRSRQEGDRDDQRPALLDRGPRPLARPGARRLAWPQA